jgi:two-component system, NtrC family, response regulator AtoC
MSKGHDEPHIQGASPELVVKPKDDRAVNGDPGAMVASDASLVSTASIEHMRTDVVRPRTRQDWSLTVVLDGGRREYTFPVGSVVTIGRLQTCEVCIEHGSVSRQHARLALHERGTIEDLASSNGTRVDGLPLPEGQQTYVRVGSVVEVGTVILLLRAPSEMEASVVVPPGCSAEMRRTFELGHACSKSSLNLLVLGPAGAGKAWLCEWVAARSPRSRLPRQVVLCQGDAQDAVELAGLRAEVPGALERSHRGVLVLRQVERLSAEARALLLRALEQQRFQRVDGSTHSGLDIRLMATSSLAPEVLRQVLGSELYERLAGVVLHLPTLNERRGELKAMAAEMLSRITPPARLTDAALGVLLVRTWEGNVRELRELLLRAASRTMNGEIRPPHFEAETALDSVGSRDEERERILAALDAAAGNQTRAAEILGVSRRTLVNRLNDLNLPRPRKGRDG